MGLQQPTDVRISAFLSELCYITIRVTRGSHQGQSQGRLATFKNIYLIILHLLWAGGVRWQDMDWFGISYRG
jgi:hypothetical protein